MPGIGCRRLCRFWILRAVCLCPLRDSGLRCRSGLVSAGIRSLLRRGSCADRFPVRCCTLILRFIVRHSRHDCGRLLRLRCLLRFSDTKLRIDHCSKHHNDTGSDRRNPVMLPEDSALMRLRCGSCFDVFCGEFAQKLHKFKLFHSNPSFRRCFCSRLRMRESVTFTLISVISKSAAISEIGDACQ